MASRCLSVKSEYTHRHWFPFPSFVYVPLLVHNSTPYYYTKVKRVSVDTICTSTAQSSSESLDLTKAMSLFLRLIRGV